MTSTTPSPSEGAFDRAERIGDDHVGTSVNTPLRPDAFVLDDAEKIARIEPLFRDIMEVLGLDLTDDSLSGTPRRVAKMYVQEIFRGLNPANHPVCKTFDNAYQYGEMLVERDITLNSTCEHHFLPIHGKAHVAYISSGRVIGLSKINRLVDHYAKRPRPGTPHPPSGRGPEVHPGHRGCGRGHGCQTPLCLEPWHRGRGQLHHHR